MPATIFSGSKVKTLKGTLNLNGGADVISSTTNPQSSAVNALKGSLLLNTTSGILYRKLDDGSSTNWEQVGSGAGTKNYIVNPDFDGGSTTGWNMKKVSLSSLVPTGNILAADAGHTIATSSSSPLEGTNSLLVQGASLFTAGNCLISDAFAIDREDQAKVLGWSFAYEAVTTNMDFPGTSAGTWAVYIAETTTATPDTIVSWIQPAGVYNLVQGTGVGIASGTFQTTASGTAYRLVLVCINSEAAATTLKVDDFKLGPQQTVFAPAMSDATSYTPVGALQWTTNATYSGRWSRAGDRAIFQVLITGSTTPSGGDTVNTLVYLPAGMAIDFSKIPNANANGAIVGYASGATISGNMQGEVRIVNTSFTDRINIWRIDPTSASAANSTAPLTTAGIAAGTYHVSAWFSLPIVGWSSNTVSSADTDTRVITGTASRTSNQSISTGVVTQISWDTLETDKTGSFTIGASGAGDYRVPVSGSYCVSTTVEFNTSGLGIREIYIRKNGVNVKRYYNNAPPALTTVQISGTTIFDAVAGDVISIAAVQNTGGALLIAPNGAVYTNVSIQRLSGPAVVQATENVSAKYETTTVQTAGNTLIEKPDFNIKLWDTHNAVSGAGSGMNGTWKFTAPISGEYQIQMRWYWQTSSAGYRVAYLYKNGSYAELLYVAPPVATAGTQYPTVCRVKLLAGEYIDFRVQQNSGGGLANNTSTGQNVVEIQRVGNY